MSVNIRGISYKGSSTSMTELIGGQVKVAIDTISSARSFIASGKLRAIEVTALKESALLQNVKSIAEQGVAGFQVVTWNGVYVPRDTPPAIVQKLNIELAKVLAQPDVRQRLLDLGHETVGGTPSELATFARSERQKWGCGL